MFPPLAFELSMDSLWRSQRLRLGVGQLLLLLFAVELSHQGQHEEKLIKDLLNGYEKLARPVKNENESLEVEFGLSLNQIVKVDEKNEMMHTRMWLQYTWMDYKLKWNESEYGGVPSVRFPPALIWTPDHIRMNNSVSEDFDSKFSADIVVYSHGLCSWVPGGPLTSSCSIDIRWFPFDDQVCAMKFNSWSYDGTKINLTNRAKTIDIAAYQPSGEWDLIAAPAVRTVTVYECCPQQPFIDIIFTIHVRRRPLYYVFNLIIPVVLMSSLTIFNFFLPPDAGEKISMSITILLSLSVFSLSLADMVPSTSVPLLGVYFVSIMVMCTMSVIMTVVVLNVHHRNPDMCKMPPWIRKLVCEWLARALRMSRPGRGLEKSLPEDKMQRLAAWVPRSGSHFSDVEDTGNAIQLDDFPSVRSGKIDSEDGGAYNLGNKLQAILEELHFITRKIKEDQETAEEASDWKFAAMVIDRLCVWVFSVYIIVTSLTIFFSAPNLSG